MAITSDELVLLDRIWNRQVFLAAQDELMLRYYLGTQHLEQLGMAIPPEMRRFAVVLNWPRVLVDTIERRQNVRALVLPGESVADPFLREVWEANNLDADLSLFNIDRQIYGRAFLSIGANEDDPEHPLIHVESPTEMGALIDYRRRRMVAAARFWGAPAAEDASGQMTPSFAALYLPYATKWFERGVDGRWAQFDESPHDLERVPVVMHLNRRRSGAWAGESALTDIIPLTDAAARSVTNLQFAQEAHGVPRMIMSGVARSDFTDPATGKLIPKWEAYFNAVHMLSSKDAKVTQLTAADLKNFETAVTLYGKQAATVTGFPARYFGLQTTNPPAEGAMRADEAQLVEGVERANAEVGTTIGWAAAVAYRIAKGTDVVGNRIRTEWHDPATPTMAQREDALAKRRAAGVLSREGYWDELGWSEARKDQEREYLRQEAAAQAAPLTDFAAKLGGA